jgi:hypothetical protein
LTTKYIAFAKTYSTTAKKLGGGNKVFQGRSKGESVNAAKNWVDMKVSVQIDPSMERVIEIAKKKAAEQAVSVTDRQILEQNIYNQELADRNAFTETPRIELLPSTNASDVAQFNREKARQEAAAAFTPVRMPKDFIAGSYTVRASYNAITQTYIVNVLQGIVSKANATFDKNSGTAAAEKHNQWVSLATKKAKYDTEVGKSYTKGGVTVKLEVTKVASLGGFLDDLLNGFGKMVNGGSPSTTGWDERYDIPDPLQHRTISIDTKLRTQDEVIKRPTPISTTFSSWDAMPQKSYVVTTNYGPKANQPMPRPTYEQALELYNEIVAGVDEFLRLKSIISPIPPSDGGGGDITDPIIGPPVIDPGLRPPMPGPPLIDPGLRPPMPAPPPAGMPLPPDATPMPPPFDYIIPPDIRPAPPTTPTPIKPTPKPGPPIDPGLIASKDIVYWRFPDGSIRQGSSYPRPANAVGMATREEWRAWMGRPGIMPIIDPIMPIDWKKKKVRTKEEMLEYVKAQEKAYAEIKAAHPDYTSIMDSPRQSPFGSFIDSTGFSDEQVAGMMLGDYHFFQWKEGKGGLPISGPIIKLLNDYKKSPFFTSTPIIEPIVRPIDPELRPPKSVPIEIEVLPPEKSENYDELVNKIVVEDTPGRIVLPQTVSTYQYMSVEDNPWAPKTTTQMTSSGAAVDNKQLLGVGLIALAGMMYYRK